MSVQTIDYLVEEAFKNALDNGYDIFDDLSIDEIVDDMMDYDADIQTYPREVVTEAVRKYRGKV